MVRYGARDGGEAPGGRRGVRGREAALGGRVPRDRGECPAPRTRTSLAEELGDWMTDNVTVVRENGKLRETETKLAGARRTAGTHRADGSLRVREPRALVHQPAPQHARARARHDAGRAPARRVPRRALQGSGPRGADRRETTCSRATTPTSSRPRWPSTRPTARRSPTRRWTRRSSSRGRGSTRIRNMAAHHPALGQAAGHADVFAALGGVRDSVPARA